MSLPTTDSRRSKHPRLQAPNAYDVDTVIGAIFSMQIYPEGFGNEIKTYPLEECPPILAGDSILPPLPHGQLHRSLVPSAG